ncbi:peptidoglycan-binding domain-containing protein [Actinophytocola sp.]|uniref:peptidoglycan-binding domain-containing protein n=1 Tax=Actinophytocola sp. TaxID=1872138 RepID=UPI002DB60ACA|nr:peptidoglycan-binding domain-containing protein [Actinophytocola sp.]
MLLSSACPPVVSMGQHDECVREVQVLLSQAGAKLEIDGDFGPATLRRVTAFQVLAGLQPRGVVDEATKRALYDQRISMATWSPEQVERRVREVFPEEPDRAVGIARCQSFLDPLHVLTNTNGTRNWGVFQLSDKLLRELGGTQLQAYDPEWNIQAARRAWSRHQDFRDWEHCDQPYRSSTPPPGG